MPNWGLAACVPVAALAFGPVVLIQFVTRETGKRDKAYFSSSWPPPEQSVLYGERERELKVRTREALLRPCRGGNPAAPRAPPSVSRCLPSTKILALQAAQWQAARPRGTLVLLPHPPSLACICFLFTGAGLLLLFCPSPSRASVKERKKTDNPRGRTLLCSFPSIVRFLCT